MAYKLKNADTYDAYLNLNDDGHAVAAQTTISVSCSETGAGTYNYFKPTQYGVSAVQDATNYDFNVTFGDPIPIIIPMGSIIYTGSKGTTTDLTAGLLNLTYVSRI